MQAYILIYSLLTTIFAIHISISHTSIYSRSYAFVLITTINYVGIRIRHIAFCDDDPDDHEIFATIISNNFHDIQLHAFFKCDVLLDYLKDENQVLPDIIFLDYNMPGNHGSECLKEIKKMVRPLHIPVIIYSTSNYKRYIEESYNSGAYRYMVKPSDYNETKAAIMKLIYEMEND